MEQVSKGGLGYCGQCGTSLAQAARFCGSCGYDVVGNARNSQSSQAGGRQSSMALAPGQHDGTDLADERPSMGLGVAWLVYLGAVGFLAVCFKFGWTNAFGYGYMATGFVMTSWVMRRISDFHPMYNTLSNVVAQKVLMFVAWPLRMFLLLMQLTVNRVL